MISPEALMQLAIEQAQKGIYQGQSPFGCAIAIGDRIIVATHNHVLAHTDITAHAEIQALRLACQSEQRIFLDGAHVATTCEPCPMCMTALHWARVDTVYYGACIADAKQAGFNELRLSAQQVLEIGGSSVKLIQGVCEQSCRDLFSQWLKHNPQAY